QKAIEEYSKRLSIFAKIEYKVMKDFDKDSFKNAYIIQINKNSEQISSEQLAEKLKDITVHGYSHIVFLLDFFSKISSDFSFSISKMDFESNILLIILYEQIYRAFCINANLPYHK